METKTIEKTIIDHDRRITTTENEVKNVKDCVSNVTDMKENLAKLTLLSQQQELRNKKLDDLYDKFVKCNAEFSATLKSINNSLISMSYEIKSTNDEIKGTNNEIKGTNEEIKRTNLRINELENKVECKFNAVNDKSKFDILELAKKGIPYLLLGGSVYYILQIVGG